MGAEAARMALADAGVDWRDVGCATAGSALALASQTIRLGEHGIGLVVGMDKHEGGAFAADPTDYADPNAFRRTS